VSVEPDSEKQFESTALLVRHRPTRMPIYGLRTTDYGLPITDPCLPNCYRQSCAERLRRSEKLRDNDEVKSRNIEVKPLASRSIRAILDPVKIVVPVVVLTLLSVPRNCGCPTELSIAAVGSFPKGPATTTPSLCRCESPNDTIFEWRYC